MAEMQFFPTKGSLVSPNISYFSLGDLLNAKALFIELLQRSLKLRLSFVLQTFVFCQP